MRRRRKAPVPQKAPTFTLGKAGRKVNPAKPALSGLNPRSGVKPYVGGRASTSVKGPA